MEFLGLKKADAESIYSELIDWFDTKNVQCNKLVRQVVDIWNKKLICCLMLFVLLQLRTYVILFHIPILVHNSKHDYCLIR